MKWTILFLVVAFIQRESSADMLPFGNCTIDDRIDVIGGIIDIGSFNDDDGFSAEYPFTGPLVVEPADPLEEYAKYIDVLIDDTNLLIKTNEAFVNFEEDCKDKDTTSPWPFQRTVELSCGAAQLALVLTGYIIDTNNHPPRFSTDSYSYTIPAPLVPTIDLTLFDEDQPIIVEDIDLSNKQIIFTSTDSAFELTTRALTSKVYRAVLKVKTPRQFDSDITFTLTATDAGSPPLTTDVMVTIKKDQSNSLPDPDPKPLTFSVALSEFEYSEENGVPTIRSKNFNEIFVVTTNPDNTVVTLSDETYAKASYDKYTSKVTISSSGTKIPPGTAPAIALTLKATLGENSNEAGIVITGQKCDKDSKYIIN